MAIRKPTEWTIEEARRHLHALIGEAEQAGPQPVESNHSQEATHRAHREWSARPDRWKYLSTSSSTPGCATPGSAWNRCRLPSKTLMNWMRKRGTFEDLERLAERSLHRPKSPLSYLLDTNVVSEFMKTPPHARYSGDRLHWCTLTLRQHFSSVVTVMEVHRGVAAFQVGKASQ